MHRRFLTDDELDALLRAITDRGVLRDQALFGLLAETGIRPSEALAITTADVSIGAVSWVRVLRLKKRRATPECDEIEISDALAQCLGQFIASRQLCAGQRLFAMNRRSTQRLFKLYARRAGLWAGFPLYVLRHTAATRMYVATRDIDVVQAMLGHENRDTSSIYAHIPEAVLAEVASTMPVYV